MHVFGSKEPGQEYKERRAVYGIIHDKSKRIGVIRLTYDQLLFLPGEEWSMARMKWKPCEGRFWRKQAI